MTNVNKWIVGGVAVVLVLGMLAVGGIAGVVYLAKREGRAIAEGEHLRQQQKQADTRTKVWDEKELNAAVMGKTTAEVKELLGMPNSTSGDPDFPTAEQEVLGAAFIYRKRIQDPHNNKLHDVSVRFKNKRVYEIFR